MKILFILNSECSVLNTTPKEVAKNLMKSKLNVYVFNEPNHGWNSIGFAKNVLQAMEKNSVGMKYSQPDVISWFGKVDFWSTDVIEGKL